jgi:hypothetical protein
LPFGDQIDFPADSYATGDPALRLDDRAQIGPAGPA